MSGYSEAQDCIRCGSIETLEVTIDRDDVTGMCLECGYEYHTVSSVMTLEEVNVERVEIEQEPLTELKPPIEGWRD